MRKAISPNHFAPRTLHNFCQDQERVSIMTPFRHSTDSLFDDPTLRELVERVSIVHELEPTAHLDDFDDYRYR